MEIEFDEDGAIQSLMNTGKTNGEIVDAIIAQWETAGRRFKVQERSKYRDEVMKRVIQARNARAAR